MITNPYLPVGLNLKDRHCVVIGNDREADEKSATLRETGADVRRIEDAANVRDEDLANAFLVISTPQDEALRASLPFAPAIALDPVSGSKLSIRANTISYEYKGRIFYFSGEDSKRTFIANPTEFTKGVFSIPK